MASKLEWKRSVETGAAVDDADLNEVEDDEVSSVDSAVIGDGYKESSLFILVTIWSVVNIVAEADDFAEYLASFLIDLEETAAAASDVAVVLVEFSGSSGGRWEVFSSSEQWPISLLIISTSHIFLSFSISSLKKKRKEKL